MSQNLLALIEYGEQQGGFALTILLNEAGDYAAAISFDRKTVSADGDSAGDVIKQLAKKCQL